MNYYVYYSSETLILRNFMPPYNTDWEKIHIVNRFSHVRAINVLLALRFLKHFRHTLIGLSYMSARISDEIYIGRYE